MSRESIELTLTILNKNYQMTCDPHERLLLEEAAEIFNQHLEDLRQKNPKLLLEQLFMLGGLQMAFNLLQEQQTFSREVSTVNQISERLLTTLEAAAAEDQKNMELES
ncbi:cell division protein ZapA [Dichelobacter nodosus]|uniref:Uncharacterized protein n=1 Tax=Dichelobacter nodosus (strain VCS1703A) TaxID=246195 RepID=A5EV36_DICNV|nr:cell division protein ZapA [Dichelobacter nodosus]ABQ13701.1 hypothetical protein DNO_0713 [Dichelobacter nodosus VCS1703A]AXM45578.1 cell division protein ZapA [Dichelobacter nodosus]KNZ38939.1 cell division protein ZapA [Dichelobacter nodosus]TGA66262.1 cell division protein ZapA [Dichelobacter nodosus]